MMEKNQSLRIHGCWSDFLNRELNGFPVSEMIFLQMVGNVKGIAAANQIPVLSESEANTI
jgi:hypothetical protein